MADLDGDGSQEFMYGQRLPFGSEIRFFRHTLADGFAAFGDTVASRLTSTGMESSTNAPINSFGATSTRTVQ